MLGRRMGKSNFSIDGRFLKLVSLKVRSESSDNSSVALDSPGARGHQRRLAGHVEEEVRLRGWIGARCLGERESVLRDHAARRHSLRRGSRHAGGSARIRLGSEAAEHESYKYFNLHVQSIHFHKMNIASYTLLYART